MTEPKGKQPVRDDEQYDASVAEGFVQGQTTQIDVTEGLRELVDDGTATPRASASPRQTEVTLETLESPVWGLMERRTPSRPKLPEHAKTAPAGALPILRGVPEPPRRAISARMANPLSPRHPRRRHSFEPSALLPRPSLFPALESRSMIHRRKNSRKSTSGRGSRKRSSVHKLVHQSHGPRYKEFSKALHEGGKASTRIKDIVKTKKKVEPLKLDIVDFNARELPNTPFSVVPTPKELYPPDGHLPKDPLTPRQDAQRRRPRPLKPPLVEKPPTLPAPPRQRDVVLRTGTILSIVAPETVAGQQQVYIPGPIQLAQETAASSATRKNSVASLEPFLDVVEGEGRRPSDDAVLDSIVSYFQELKVVGPAAEDELDRFWEPAKPTTSPLDVGRGSRGPTRPTRPALKSLPSSSAAVDTSTEPTGEQRRPSASSHSTSHPRIRLRRLLGSVTSLV